MNGDEPVSPAEEGRRAELAATAADLKEEVAGLRVDVRNLKVRTVRAERASFRSGLVAMALLLVVLLLGWNAYQQNLTADRLESLIQRSLCPVYALAVGNYDPSTRKLNPDGSYPGSDREKYDRNNAVMARAYNELQCIGGLVPKRLEN